MKTQQQYLDVDDDHDDDDEKDHHVDHYHVDDDHVDHDQVPFCQKQNFFLSPLLSR